MTLRISGQQTGVETVAAIQRPSAPVLYLPLRSAIRQAEKLLKEAPLPAGVRVQGEQWIKTVGAMGAETPLDALDEALALAELMLYIIRPAMGDDLTLAEIDEALEGLLQTLLPAGKSAEAFIQEKVTSDIKTESAILKIAHTRQVGADVAEQMTDSATATSVRLQTYYGDSQVLFGGFNRRREAMAETAAATATEVYERGYAVAQQLVAVTREIGAVGEELGELERLADATYDQILGGLA
jgi:hypothetical protein